MRCILLLRIHILANTRFRRLSLIILTLTFLPLIVGVSVREEVPEVEGRDRRLRAGQGVDTGDRRDQPGSGMRYSYICIF